MKPLLLLCLLSFPALQSLRSAVLLDEPFEYPDGALALVSAGRWVNHGGGSNQMEVTAGRVNLTQTQTEDLHALLAGGPYRGPALYAGFVVNCAALPGGDGAYFAHFKDDTSTGFRARVYAATNGAGPGKWRAGMATGAGAPVMIPADLDPGTDYTLVLRYQTGSPASTLWLAPVSESSASNRAEATDPATTLSITSFGLRQALASGNGIGTLRLDRLRIGTAFRDVIDGFDPRLDPPALGAIADQTIPANHSTPAVPFLIQDEETAADNLLLRAASDNPGLIGASGVAFGGGGSNRTVTVTPTPGRQGAARVTVTVTDADGNTANGTFQVTVGVPSLSELADQSAPHDTATAPIPFRVGDAESDPLTLWAASTNEPLLPEANVRFSGAGSNRTMVLEPVSGLTGLSRVTVFLSDGFNVVSNSFLFTVFPTRGLVLSDAFTYPDGSLVTNSQSVWITHSASLGQTGQTQVAQGRLLLSGAQSEDIHALLADAPYTPAGAWMLYARFSVNFAARPAAGGDYFAHFRGANSGSSARVFATANGAAPGKLRLGLANNSADPSVILPVELDTNTTYTVVTRLNVATGESTLWLNPTLETDPGATANDEPAPFDVYSYAFRQSSGIGSVWLDDLELGTTFADVVPGGFRLRIGMVNGVLEVAWPQAAQLAGYRLQSTDTDAANGWDDVGLEPEPNGSEVRLRLSAAGEQRFFRLGR